MLTDNFNRDHTYLRIALTDNCNFRCTYCMPCEKIKLLPPGQLMTADEVITIAKHFSDQGVNKIRLTGGEPLLRKDVKEIITGLGRLPVELMITTNGTLVHQYLDTFHSAGIRQVNVSLDTMDRAKFQTLTKRDAFITVWSNINLLIKNGFSVKLNVVLMKGINDNEITDFIKITSCLPVSIRFIEFMPFNGNQWEKGRVISAENILQKAVINNLQFEQLPGRSGETSVNYKLKNAAGTFGIISTMSKPFCAGCNRIRLTADGKMKNCLFSALETDLLTPLRSNQDIVPLMKKNVRMKFREQGGQLGNYETINSETIINRSMVRIGG